MKLGKRRLRLLYVFAILVGIALPVSKSEPAAAAATELRFVEGNPGAPGDGSVIQAASGVLTTEFELASPVPLVGMTDGFTLTAFPRVGVLTAPRSVRLQFLVPSAIADACGFRAPTGPTLVTRGVGISGQITLNSVAGYFVNVPLSEVNAAVDIIRRAIPTCQISFSDLSLWGFSLAVTGDADLITSLDAAYLGVGQGALPDAQPGLPGDINGDCVVNTFDRSLLLAAFRTYDPRADLNNDGVINSFDMAILNANFNRSCDTSPPSSTLRVNTTVDEIDANPGDGQCRSAAGRCSLRAAVMEANARPGADAITVPPGTYQLTIPGGQSLSAAAGDLDIADNLTIAGSGRVSTIIDGNGGVTGARVFRVRNGVNATISRLTIKGGRAPDDFGGGILNQGDLRLSEVEVSGNDAGVAGGGIRNNGGLTLFSVGVTENHAGSFGGALSNFTTRNTLIQNSSIAHNRTEGNGGAITQNASGSVLTIEATHISGNFAAGGGGIAIGTTIGGVPSTPQVVLRNSTLSFNSASSFGGGISLFSGSLVVSESTIQRNIAAAGNGGGIVSGLRGVASPGSVSITNSTISGNIASGGGGAIATSTATDILNSTLAANSARDFSGGGINAFGNSVRLKNTIVAGNTAPGASNCFGPMVTQGTNLDSDRSCSFTGAGDLSGVDPRLGALANNDGRTQTHALQATSPAIDAANGCPATDQRGVTRPQGPACDIGAYEFQGTPAELRDVVFIQGINSYSLCADENLNGYPDGFVENVAWMTDSLRSNALINDRLRLRAFDYFSYGNGARGSGYCVDGRTPTYGQIDTCDGVAQASAELRDLISTRTSGRVTIVAHSMGGLVAAYLAVTESTEWLTSHIASVITFDSPLRGLPTVYREALTDPILNPGGECDFNSPSVTEMDPTNLVVSRASNAASRVSFFTLDATALELAALVPLQFVPSESTTLGPRELLHEALAQTHSGIWEQPTPRKTAVLACAVLVTRFCP